MESLPNFVKLNNSIYFYKPSATSSGASSDASLVILCTWAFAQLRHILKYIRGYQDHYPATAILLVQSDTSNYTWRPLKWQDALLMPAVLCIKDYVSSTSRARVLVHVFSNGGCHHAAQLAEAYRKSFGSDIPEELPVHAIIFDSAPGLAHHELNVRGMEVGLPKRGVVRLIGVPVVRMIFSWYYLLDWLGISELMPARGFRLMNSAPYLISGVRTPRAYIYSNSDAVMDHLDILKHASEARAVLRKGEPADEEGLIRVEEFEESQHVNHVSVDPNRYWMIINDIWKVMMDQGK